MGHDITLFTVPRSFEGEIGIIQANAVKSWCLLQPRPEILFVSDDPGVEEMATRYGCRHVPGVRCNEYGTPLVSDVFRKGQGAASHAVKGYINSDIVLTQPFVGAVRRAAAIADKFLMIGRRTDFYYPQPIDFSEENWALRLTQKARKKGHLHGPAGIDYFIFGGWGYRKISDFYLGRRAWDNWLVWYALRRKDIIVIDATQVVCAIHVGKTINKPITPEIEHNRRLADQAGTWGRTNFATVALQPEYDYPGELYVKN